MVLSHTRLRMIVLYLTIKLWNVTSEDIPYYLPLVESLDISADVASQYARNESLDTSIFSVPGEEEGIYDPNKMHKFGTVVDSTYCIKECSGHGECQAVFK